MPSFQEAREYLLTNRDDYGTAYGGFEWPRPTGFNWALDWFDTLPADGLGLWIVEEDGSERKWTFGELSNRSNQVANWLRDLGVRRGDRIILMLGNQGELWEVILAAAFMRYRRFSEFESRLGPPPSVLSERLRRFTELDVFYQNGAEYRLTPKGQAFFPIYAFLVDWAQRWFAGAPDTGIAIRHETCQQSLRPYLRCTSCLEPMSRTAIKFDVDTP
ncbi:AMP-binding protein [Kibdelosporangium lantanae]|uniref:AMP-binding protein n=1 Tax=Kibdelosporangium lantanae TaxID=1497396 RepID=A0ABW3MDR1_9PSEU